MKIFSRRLLRAVNVRLASNTPIRAQLESRRREATQEPV
ncbi:MAG: hypothetical protein JWO52_3915 [Gammaproteobacteria bacterium]|jgi:hypothetical protein|nr:hypothetical protein [Gammaproteobacteria bacterium]